MPKRPVFTPPVQRKHLYYRLTWFFVWGGVMRFFRVRGVEGMHHIPPARTPAILISNHQNGLMDPLVSCAFVTSQIHWLTRADVFWNPVARHIMYGYNQMPIYRRRDRVENLRERNDIIFDVCVERLAHGAFMGIFPEGNHNLFPSLRELRGGLAEMVVRAKTNHPSMPLQVVPVGLDYEQYATYGSQLRVRGGAPVQLDGLFNAEGELDKPEFNRRVRASLREVMVDIQPEDAQPFLHAAVRAHRTTERFGEAWTSFRATLDGWATRWTEDAEWAQRVQQAHRAWDEAVASTQALGRPEAWGLHAGDVRPKVRGFGLLRVLGMLGNAPTWPTMKFVQHRVRRMTQKDDFVSTLSMGLAILLYPLTWLTLAGLAAWLAPEGMGWLAAAGMWVWGQTGSRLSSWVEGLAHQHRDARDGRAFWHTAEARPVRDAWRDYLEVLGT